MIITADHGCDPGYTATTDHTREYVPMLILGTSVPGKNLGTLPSYTAVAEAAAAHLGVAL